MNIKIGSIIKKLRAEMEDKKDESAVSSSADQGDNA